LDPESLVAQVLQSPRIEGRNLAQEVSPREPVVRAPSGDGRFHVAVVDPGTKEGIVRDLLLRGTAVTSVPYDLDAGRLLALEPDGVMIGSGPGDPAALEQTIRLIRDLLERMIPVAGICLGHQLLCLALGAQRYKMRFGHRGDNHPVKDTRTGRVLITTQNHGFAVDPTSLGIPWEPLDMAFCSRRPAIRQQGSRVLDGSVTMADLLPSCPLIGKSPLGFGPVEVTHLSLNDGTLEGLALRDLPAFAVQFHPEASPGPHDAKPLFERFFAMMEEHRA
jgi:carbamoyl-phosphate synthase small subunit